MSKKEQIEIYEEKFKRCIREILGPIQYISFDDIPCVETSDTTKLCKSPLVSILCITYNHEKHIQQTLRGFEMQKCNFEFEILIGEDCSTDSTLKLCKEFQKKHPEYVRIITSEKNVGAKRNSFRINNLARGKYIALCEGDDCWITEDKLQKQVDFLEANSEYNLIFTNAEIRDTNNKFIKLFHTETEINSLENCENQLFDRLSLKWAIPTATTIMRREDRNKLHELNPQNIFTEQRRLGDIQLWSGIMSLGKMKYFSDATACYHLSNESASRSKDKMRTFLLFCDTFEMYIKSNIIFNNNDNVAYKNIMRRTATQCLFRAYEVKQLKLVKTANKLLKLYGERYPIITINSICCAVHAPFWLYHLLLKCNTGFNICLNKLFRKK